MSTRRPTINHRSVEHYQADRPRSSYRIVPKEEQQLIPPFIKRSRGEGISRPNKPASGIRKPSEVPSTRHVRFVSVPLPSRPSPPSPLPRSSYVYQNISEYQRSSSLTVPERLGITSKDKGTTIPTKRIEELTRENSLLRQVLLYYKAIYTILINFLHVNKRLQKGLGSLLDNTLRRLATAE